MPPLIKSANIEPDIKVRCVCARVCLCVRRVFVYMLACMRVGGLCIRA